MDVTLGTCRMMTQTWGLHVGKISAHMWGNTLPQSRVLKNLVVHPWRSIMKGFDVTRTIRTRLPAPDLPTVDDILSVALQVHVAMS